MEGLASGWSVRSRSVLSCSEGHAGDQPEESSWTGYFVDFMMSEEEEAEKRRRRHLAGASCCAYGDVGGEEMDEEDPMVSDAASSAPAATLPAAGAGRCMGLKKLKKKAFKVLDHHDDSLEDTASSPVNSPKVSALSQQEFSPKRRCNVRDLTKEVVVGDDQGRESVVCADAMVQGVRFVDESKKGITPCAELKDKGLCLLPFSMLLNYHG